MWGGIYRRSGLVERALLGQGPQKAGLVWFGLFYFVLGLTGLYLFGLDCVYLPDKGRAGSAWVASGCEIYA